jgi:hypothetical protein
MTFKISFDGVLRETHVLPSSEEINNKNLSLMIQLYKKLTGASQGKNIKAENGEVWREIPLEKVLDFIEEFRFHREIRGYKESLISYAKEVSDKHPKWDIAFVSLVNGLPAYDDLPMAVQKRQVGRIDGFIKTPSEEPGWYVGNKQKVAGTGVERIGLNEKEMEEARNIAREDGRETPTDRDYRHKKVRGRPLLMLHLLELFNENDEKIEVVAKTIPAIGFSFPAMNDNRSVECVVNKVWLEKDMIDSPDEEDDFDN